MRVDELFGLPIGQLLRLRWLGWFQKLLRIRVSGTHVADERIASAWKWIDDGIGAIATQDFTETVLVELDGLGEMFNEGRDGQGDALRLLQVVEE